MPGASLWVIPPQSSHFNQIIQTLVSKTIPAHFPNTKTHDFIPHVTITSNIDKTTYAKDPQTWLDSLPLDQLNFIPIALDCIEPGEPFFKKLTIRAERIPQTLALAAACRAHAVLDGDESKATKWSEEEYLPHLSLMYAELPSDDVATHLDTIIRDMKNATLDLSADIDGVVARGGSLVLVDTSNPIHEWTVIAARELPLSWYSPWSSRKSYHVGT